MKIAAERALELDASQVDAQVALGCDCPLDRQPAESAHGSASSSHPVT